MSEHIALRAVQPFCLVPEKGGWLGLFLMHMVLETVR